MRLLFAARRFCARCNPFRRRHPSASSVNILLADILWRLRHMEPSADAQAIIDQVNKLPSAIAAEVASEVTTAEAAKDAQKAADFAAIQAAMTTVSGGVGVPAGA